MKSYFVINIVTNAKRILTTLLLTVSALVGVSDAAEKGRDTVKGVVDKAIQPVMKKYNIAGMTVGIAVAGTSYVFDYGVACTETRKPVTQDTLFEIGSITKTFTATLASLAQVDGRLSLSDKVSRYLPALQRSKFGDLTLLNLGTHTPGGLPLQVPEYIRNNNQLMTYFKEWQPACAPGTCRTYSNPSIGTLGLIAATSMHRDFAELIKNRLFSSLGMNSSYINIPESKTADYAQGYTKEDAPIRMSPGVLWSEAYGIRSTAADMIRFVEANMSFIKLDDKVQRAIRDTHTGYFQAGVMTQDLIWEQYPYPVKLQRLLQGNSYQMIFESTPVTRLVPPHEPRNDVWINKTGSTNGFGAYVAFIPSKRLGIVILANKNYPIADRVTVAHQILTGL